MKRALFLLTLVQPVLATSYYYADAFTSLNAGAWTQNGSVAVGGGLSAPDAEGGSLVSQMAVPDAIPREHEVSVTLSLPAAGGTYVSYLNATPDARIGPTTATGSFYAIEISPGAVSATGGGWATLRVRKSIAGVITDLQTNTVPCKNGTIVRSVYRSSTIFVYVDQFIYAWPTDSEVPTGRPGIGAYATPSGANVVWGGLAAIERVQPGAVDVSKLSSYALPNEVQLQWTGVQDAASGSGVYAYHVYRDGQYIAAARTSPYVDSSAAPSTTYSYTIYACDFHQNWSAASTVQVSTPPAGTIDPRRVGVRPTGAYWGAMGEQIDLFSGNLNVSIPLLKAMGRGGWTVPISLSYNSQIWRYHSNQNWLLGRDVGYGLGWRLMAGSLVPEWSNSWAVHHYTFTDASGTEYRLDVNTNGVWTSRDGTHVSYDAANERLYWPDGTFWVMRCVSAGTEEDAGTLYPTIIEDTNGNQVLIRYKTGVGVSWTDSSARIDSIVDVRGPRWGTLLNSYTFGYDTNNRLTRVNNNIGTAERYTFNYISGQPLYSPFNSQQFGNATLLQSVSNDIPLTHSFEYSGNFGELTRVVFPYGGDLRWAYRSFSYYGGQTLREVQYRSLSKAAGAALSTYTFLHDDSGGACHVWTVLRDPGGIGEKAWWFGSNGLNTAYEERPAPSQVALRRQDFTWTQDAAGRPYIGTALTTLDPGTAWQAQSKTEQSLDTHGNIVWTKVYDYGNLSTPARTYDHTYLTSTNYTSRFMFNRPVSATVTPAGGGPITLFTNLYDVHACNVLYQLPVGTLLWDTAYTAIIHRGNLANRSTPNGSMCYVRDFLGGLRAQMDGAGHMTTFDSDSSTGYTVPSVITGGGVTNNFTYTSFLGIASVTETNGSAALFSYDTAARPTETTSPHGAKTTYTYTTSPPTSTATTNGRFVKTTYDGLGRTIKVERGDGAPTSPVTRSVVDTEYDVCACSPLGKVKRVSQPYAPGATIYWTTYNYDGLGRLLSVVAPDGSSTGTYLYQGRTTRVTDPAGKWKKFATDALGNLVQVTEPNPSGGIDFETYYTYDALNNLTQVSMPRSGFTQTRTFAYQGNLLTSATNPESGTTTYTYYADGKLATRTDARNRRIEYTYDSYDRLTRERGMSFLSGQWSEVARKEYQWDNNNIDPSVSEYASGRLAAVTDGSPGKEITYLYGYTPAGLITTKQLRANGAPLTGTWAYNDEGKITTVNYPSGGTYTYSYDGMGRLSGLNGRKYDESPAQSMVSSTQYNAAGQLTEVDYEVRWRDSGGYTHTESYYVASQYNAASQLTRLTSGRWMGDIGGLPDIDLEYRYTAGQNNGRIAQSKDWKSGEEVTYTYDSLNRLTGAATTGPEWGTTYTYDGWGNLTAKTATKGTAPSWSNAVDPATNRLVGYTYDAAGNQGDPANYDTWNRLAPRMYDFTSPVYGYDVYNKRVVRAVGGGLEDIVFYGIDGRKLETFRQQLGTGSLRYLYSFDVYFANKPIISESRWVITDRLGSVRGDGQTYRTEETRRYDYYPYGEERTTTPGDRTKFGTYFRDGVWDSYDYADQRYYASSQGRFMTPDPYQASAGLTDPGSWNRYTYTRGDPVNRRDRRGLWDEWADEDSENVDPIEDPEDCDNNPGDPRCHLPEPGAPSGGFFDMFSDGYLDLVLNHATKALARPDCAGLFGWAIQGDASMDPDYPYPGSDPAAVLKELTKAGRITFADLSGMIEATSDGIAPRAITEVTDQIFVNGRWEWTNAKITINNQSGADYWGATNSVVNAVTLLHELGHVYGIVAGMGGSSIVYDHGNNQQSWANTALIEEKCFK